MADKKTNKMTILIGVSDEANFRCLLDVLSDRKPKSRKKGNHSKVMADLMKSFFNKNHKKLTEEQKERFNQLVDDFIQHKHSKEYF